MLKNYLVNLMVATRSGKLREFLSCRKFQENTGSFQVIENLRETQADSGKFEDLKNLRNFFFLDLK